jgi:hypothetical protein
MTRVALVAIVLLGVVAAGAAPAGATNECKGLQSCVRVAGPWVVVPASQSPQRPNVEFQLSCPRGFIVAGLDAELSDRAIDVRFYARLGSPVNPGVSTSRSAVFVASYTGATPRGVTFRPHIGCIRASGGGSGPVPFRLPQGGSAVTALPPGQPTVRRLRTVRLRAGATQRIVQACGRGERVVGGWHAVGFATRSAPSASEVAAVRTTRSVGAARVSVLVRTGATLAGTRALVQVGAVCAGGS